MVIRKKLIWNRSGPHKVISWIHIITRDVNHALQINKICNLQGNGLVKQWSMTSIIIYASVELIC